MAESAYRQPSSSHSSGTFPDLYATLSTDNRDSPVGQINESDDNHLSDPSPQVISDNRGIDPSKGFGTTRREGTFTEILARGVPSATPVGTGENSGQHTDGNSGITDGKKSKLQSQFTTESSFSLGVDSNFVEHTLSGENDIDSVTTLRGREDKSKNGNENINFYNRFFEYTLKDSLTVKKSSVSSRTLTSDQNNSDTTKRDEGYPDLLIL